jgi:hypothetical protein
MASPTEITPAQPVRLIGPPNAPILIDEVSTDDPRLMPNARRHAFRDIEPLVPEFSGNAVEAYCPKGVTISRGAMALLRASEFVAEINRHDLAPEATGLLATSLGLSRKYRRDLDRFETSQALYNAFYLWERDAITESHDWPALGGLS